MDTIYALASAQGRAGVAIVRVSGPAAHAAVRTFCGDTPIPRRATLCNVRDAEGGLLDKALVLTFPEGGSFTGEAVAEFHLHGSRAIVAAVLRALSGIPGLRMAEAGEFTRRAMENGRLDLTEVEGLADLIAAETEAQRMLALRVFDGALGRKVAGWRADLVTALSLLAVSIDFADEEVPTDATVEVAAILDRLIAGIEGELSGLSAAARIRDGFEVAIVGPPNIGKSTLLNALAGRDAAITSAIAGTTRDVIEVRMDLGGLPVTFLDTAGLRDTEDRIDVLGLDRARLRAANACLRIILTDGDTQPVIEPDAQDLVVRGKADLVGRGVSGKTGHGVPELMARVSEILGSRAALAGVATQERHRVAMEDAVSRLTVGAAQISDGIGAPELLSEDIRGAVTALDALVGKVDVEDLLDVIFKTFCIGK